MSAEPNICAAIKDIARVRDDVIFVYPVHLNPAVQLPVREELSDCPNVILLEPLPYKSLLAHMEKSELILTDSGGIQEEACVLRKPVIVLRDTTERAEGVEAGAALLLGTNRQTLIDNIHLLLDSPHKRNSMSQAAGNLYGDGHAAERIVEYILTRQNN